MLSRVVSNQYQYDGIELLFDNKFLITSLSTLCSEMLFDNKPLIISRSSLCSELGKLILANMQVCVHACLHAYVQTCRFVCVRACMHVCKHAGVCMPACM